MQISKKYILPSQIGELTREYGITTKARRTRRVRIFILLNFVTSLSKIWDGVEGFAIRVAQTLQARRSGMDCRNPVDMDVSGRILRAWLPAIHAGMTEAADGQNPRRTLAVAWREIPPFYSLRASPSS